MHHNPKTCPGQVRRQPIGTQPLCTRQERTRACLQIIPTENRHAPLHALVASATSAPHPLHRTAPIRKQKSRGAPPSPHQVTASTTSLGSPCNDHPPFACTSVPHPARAKSQWTAYRALVSCSCPCPCQRRSPHHRSTPSQARAAQPTPASAQSAISRRLHQAFSAPTCTNSKHAIISDVQGNLNTICRKTKVHTPPHKLAHTESSNAPQLLATQNPQ